MSADSQTCSVFECTSPVYGDGLCGRHFQQRRESRKVKALRKCKCGTILPTLQKAEMCFKCQRQQADRARCAGD